MRFHADLHVHSKYSRATSRDLDLEHLSFWACRKGVALVGTGDFTHPAWRAELGELLVPAEPGLFRLRGEVERGIEQKLPAECRACTRFMLTVEISTIYKKGDRTRKVHHLLCAPDFETSDRISASLARIGNIASDGRPILGLDSRHLLEIALEAGPGACLIPAHIWTPWFAALGSQSGFDSIVECYGDLSSHIFAVETGLSSDPPMNWRVSQLDRYRLVSNSDAHSPGRLGREATTFDTELDYFSIRRALEAGDGYAGTVEFFPEEGKYHLDGHRKCGVRMMPDETREHGNRCPACGQPVTIGVLNRVEALADRPEAALSPPSTAGEVVSLVPLLEVLSELARSGPSSRTVERDYDRLLALLGPELAILCTVPLEDIARHSSPLLAEAVARLRAGRVIREAGYDGEYGKIRLFEGSEIRRIRAGGSLFGEAVGGQSARARNRTRRPEPAVPQADIRPVPDGQARQPSLQVQSEPGRTLAAITILAPLDEDQRRAVEVVQGQLAIVAGPGSGKTRTITHRLAYLVAEHGVPASSCLAITFTRRAADEMRERLAQLLPEGPAIAVHTFHSLGLAVLRDHGALTGVPRDFRVAGEAERAAILTEKLSLSATRAGSLLRAFSRTKRTGRSPSKDIADALHRYQQEMAARNWVDFDDLVACAVKILASDSAAAEHYQRRFRWIVVDEFQDVDEQQYRLLTLLAPADGNLCVVGDPRQAIYGFRGADAACFEHFARDYPAATTVLLTRNYRSTGTIAMAASQLMARSSAPGEPIASIVREMHERITVHTAQTGRAEAEFVVATIEQMLGGHSFFSIDSGRSAGGASALGLADFAVLARTSAQTEVMGEALLRSGLPFHSHAHDALAGQPAVRALLCEWERGLTGGLREGDLAAQLRAAANRLSEDVPGASSKDQALQRLLALADACRGDEARFGDAVALATEVDFRDPRAERVSLLTLHASKGLEFAVVFIVGLEEGLMPFYWHDTDEATEAEERRLLYVGMTRAKDRLILTRAERRLWRGQMRERRPSPFLLDIEQELLKQQRTQRRPTTPEARQLRLL